MEARSATVTKTPFNSYNIVTCTMKELAQCQLEFGSKLFVLFNLVSSPPLLFTTLTPFSFLFLKKMYWWETVLN